MTFQLVGFQGDALTFSGTINANTMSGTFSNNGGAVCTDGDAATWTATKTSSSMNVAGVWQFTAVSDT